ncbi:hypothetical protein AAG565_09560 [Fontimonas sp. SYSU GA230001]|uniref:hypothetical protein n=1 Tax=Fontimonas sp. SYSU GA230001 TaxID=3142450 RepID=UPI0032B3964F
MRKTFLLAATLVLALVPLARAEVLNLPPDSDAVPANLPMRGLSQANVLHAYGEPLKRHPPAGGGHPRQPPITRWDYDGYSVFFENNIVIDVVVKDAPKPLHNVDELQPEP